MVTKGPIFGDYMAARGPLVTIFGDYMAARGPLVTIFGDPKRPRGGASFDEGQRTNK